MNTDLRKILVGLGLVLLSSQSDARAEDPPVLKLGVIQSLTGMAAEDGKNILNSIQLAADKAAREGTKIELLVEDDRSDAKESVSAFQKLAASGVHAIVGSTWSFVTSPLIPLAGQKQILLVNTSNFPDSFDLEPGEGCSYVVSAGVKEDAAPFEEFLKAVKPKTASIISVNAPWGEIQREEYRRLLELAQVQIVSEESPLLVDANDWGIIAAKLKSQNPDVEALLVNKNDIALFLRRARELKLTSKIFASMMAYDAINEAKEKEIFDGVTFTYPYDALRSSPEFFSTYSKRYSYPPRIYANSSYRAVLLIADAFQGIHGRGDNLCEAFDKTLGANAGLLQSFQSSLMRVSGGEARLKIK